MAGTITVERIVRAGLCHGCGGCAAALPDGRLRMSLSESGYLRPQASEPLTAEEQSAAVRVCSGYTLDGTDDRGDPVWGALTAVRTGHAADEAVRFSGSSGGVISALLLHLIESGTVAFALHTVADATDPFGNAMQESRSRADVLAAAGSRYAPSSPLATLRRYLDGEARFAFVGKPCDVASLRRMARHDPRINARIPVMISFMCAGIPSRQGALDIIAAMGADPADVERFSFRGDGWPGYARAHLNGGRRLQMSYNDSWGKVLSRRLQFRCKICPDGVGEFADIVCADAWFSKDGYPDFEEKPGRSLILSRTSTGEAAVQAALVAGAIRAEQADAALIARMQPYQFNRKCSLLARLLGLWLAGGRLPRFRRLHLIRAAFRGGPILSIRNFLGTMRRALKNGTEH